MITTVLVFICPLYIQEPSSRRLVLLESKDCTEDTARDVLKYENKDVSDFQRCLYAIEWLSKLANGPNTNDPDIYKREYAKIRCQIGEKASP